MSDLNYYGAHPAAALPHRTGLTVWGVVLIALGSLFAASAVIAAAVVPVLMWARAPAAPRPAPAAEVRLMLSVATGAMTAAGLGGGLVWLGVGSCRGRRWVAPLIVAGGPLVIAFGGAVLLTVAAGLIRAVTGPASAAAAATGPFPPRAMLALTSAVGLVFGTGLYVALPAAIVWFYGRRSVADTLAILDPVRRWTDDVPVRLLRWVVACGYTGGVMILLAAGGTAVAFTAVLDGWAAAGPLLAVGGVFAVAAVGSYRRSTAAWAAGVATFALVAASTLTFAAAGDSAGYVRRMADRMAGLTSTANTNGFAQTPADARLLWLGMGIVYAGLAAYGLWVRPTPAGPPADA